MYVHFRKRFGENVLAAINEHIVESALEQFGGRDSDDEQTPPPIRLPELIRKRMALIGGEQDLPLGIEIVPVIPPHGIVRLTSQSLMQKDVGAESGHECIPKALK